MATRRGKWHPPPVPTPRIIHLPRRSRLSGPPKAPASKVRPTTRLPPGSGRNLGALLDEERSLSGGHSERRAKVEVAALSGESGGDSGEERWRFQAEILRAECNFLRMERAMALRKLERNRSQMEAALRSAMETLISGRNKINGSESVEAALEEEIEELEEKLEELQLERSGRRRGIESFRELPRSCRRNFDRQASVLRRRLEKMPDETSVREIREIAAEEKYDNKNSPLQSDRRCRFLDKMEMLKTRMEGLSKGMWERIEEYGCLLSTNFYYSHSTAGSSDSVKTSGQRVIDYTEMAEKAHTHYQQQPQQQQVEEKRWAVIGSGNCCNCKVVGRIMEQVRVETEQWSEMQGMLDQVRVEMEELQSSRELWQHRAITSDIDMRSIQSQMLEWKQRAYASEHKVTELQKQMSELQIKLQSTTVELFHPSTSSTGTRSKTLNQDFQRIKHHQHRLLDSHREKEKHALVRRFKNSQKNFPRRSPLQDIGNTSMFRP
ncbi:myosin heavy chain, embryonic smooth muscle isoform-like [Phoenix dactylifera]|uniref:Myosin heavy chain, embryonic smooth muscle isoform-like n=1 Tax=Phoenix dactylifera TaxID=42345 RepID=A0A8B7CLK5_PHODC|nr:myosin heavy chain, embryonic smooth muscle isoform-like [Phoenix dactylifera]